MCASCWFFSHTYSHVTMHGSENVKSVLQLKVRKKDTVKPTVLLTAEVAGTARFKFFMPVFMKDRILTNVTPCTLVTFD